MKKVILGITWAGVFIWHPLIALWFVPAFIAIARSHRHPDLVFFFTLFLGWTPAWVLILLYSIERNDRPSPMFARFGRRGQRISKRGRNKVQTTVRTVII